MNITRTVLVILSFNLLLGCTGLWTGIDIIYDRHAYYNKLIDLRLSSAVNQAIGNTHLCNYRHCCLEWAVFNKDILLVGQVPNDYVYQRIINQIKSLKTYRQLFIYLTVGNAFVDNLSDSWITMNIRAQVLADASINPKAFKVVTHNNIVYLMGEIKFTQAQRLIYIARQTKSVKKVVSVLRYYQV